MDTRFLETLLTVFDCGSVAEAGRRLNMTAAGVTQRIHALEVDIGATLVFRSGRTIRPTPAAISILGQSRRLLAEVGDLRSIATSGMLTGELRLGVIQSSLSVLLPDLLIPFTKAHPGIDVRIERDHSAGLYQRVVSGDIDVAITSQPPFVIPKTCGWRVLRQEPFVVLTPKSLRMRSPHEILASQPFIRLTRNVYAGQLIDSYLRKARIRPKERFEFDGFELIVVLVDRGLGVSVLPDLAPSWPEGLSLRKLPLPGRSFRRTIGLLWDRSSHRLKLIEAFADEAQVSIKPKSSPITARKQRSFD